jgi:hypothetical protein
MNNILNQKQLDVARILNGFSYKSAHSIADEIKDLPLSVRYRVMESLHEFATGLFFASGFWADAEDPEVDRQFKASLLALEATMVPEVVGSPDSLKDVLSGDGADILRGQKIDFLPFVVESAA